MILIYIGLATLLATVAVPVLGSGTGKGQGHLRA